jgi:hypothetical protein
MMTPIDPTTPIAVTLQVQAWNALLGILNDQTAAPYRVTAPLIEAITSQANAAVAALQPPELPAPPALPNGEDRHVSD